MPREVPISMFPADRHQLRRLIDQAHDEVDAERRRDLVAFTDQDSRSTLLWEMGLDLAIEKRRGDTLRKALLVAMAYGALMTAAVLGLWSVR